MSDGTDALDEFRYFRDQQFGDLLALVIAMAAKTHPEALKQALASVFDLSGIEESAKRCMNVLIEVQTGAQDARDKLREAWRAIDLINKRIDGIQQPVPQNGKPAERKA